MAPYHGTYITADEGALPMDSWLASILDWMGMPQSPAAVAETVERRSFARVADEAGDLRRTRSARPGRWRESLSKREVEIVDAIAAERLERYGYER